MGYQEWTRRHRMMVPLLAALGAIPGVIVMQHGGFHGAANVIAALFAVIVTSVLLTRGAWLLAPDGRSARGR